MPITVVTFCWENTRSMANDIGMMRVHPVLDGIAEDKQPLGHGRVGWRAHHVDIQRDDLPPAPGLRRPTARTGSTRDRRPSRAPHAPSSTEQLFDSVVRGTDSGGQDTRYRLSAAYDAASKAVNLKSTFALHRGNGEVCVGTLLIVLAAVLFIASLVVLVVALRRPKAPTGRPPGSAVLQRAMPQFGPRQLGPGAIVSYGGVDYVVRGSVTFREGPFVWWEHLLEGGDQPIWFSVEEDDGRLKLAMWVTRKDL